MIELVLTIGGVCGAILTALALIKAVYALVQAVQGVMHRLEAVEASQGVLEARTRQLTNNGGSHMKDTVERVEVKLDAHIEDEANWRRTFTEQLLSLKRGGV